MYVAGCDVGSLTAKAVILENENPVSSEIITVNGKPAESAEMVMKKALDRINLSMKDLASIIGTGYGRKQIPFADGVESEIVCHAVGVRHYISSSRMIIDIGGQDAKVTKTDDEGKVVRYVYNDKCASGTGRFLEVMADALDIQLDQLGEMDAQHKEKLSISNQCVIFAETEVISLVNEGKEIADIIHALHQAMANRVASLAKSIGLADDIVLTGGVAKNSGIFSALSMALGVPLKPLAGIDPQINGAFGAALLGLK
jgi:predicted CoA-substrate-specific enzyme activase